MVWAAAGLGLAVGSFAAWRFPHVLDCGQLIWQGRLVSEHAEGLTGSDGALGFSGLTWWLPDLLSRPLTVAAAAIKPALGLFCALGVLRLGRGAWPERPGVAAGLIGLLLLASHYGQMDLLQLGKNSSWAVALTLAFVGTAASTRTSTLALDPDVTRRASALYLALIPSVALALTATRDTPLWMALAQSAAVLGACAAGARFLMPLAGRIPRFSSTGLGIGALIALLAGVALMPVEVSRVKLIEPGGLLHMHSDAPFDGRCSYWTYLAGYASGVSPLTVLLGLLVAITLPFLAPSRFTPARMAGATFIAFAAAAMVVVARVGTVVLNPLNVWDLGRNLPIRFLAPLASFGVLSAIGSLERGRTRSNRRRGRLRSAVGRDGDGEPPILGGRPVRLPRLDPAATLHHAGDPPPPGDVPALPTSPPSALRH